MIQAINAKIGPLDFEIRSARDQQDRTQIYALVNTSSDSFTQLATTFSADEIAYVKRILDAMFEENNTRTREVMAVKQMRAMQLARAPPRNRQSQSGDAESESQALEAGAKTITQEEADNVLAQLVVQGFFRKSRAGYYSLAPRALMELRAYLKETYNDPPPEDEEDVEPTIRIRDCEGCKEIVTVGLRCSDKDCGVRWHDGCANAYFRGQQGDAQCLRCKKGWTGDAFVGERADRLPARGSVNGRRSTTVQEDEAD